MTLDCAQLSLPPGLMSLMDRIRYQPAITAGGTYTHCEGRDGGDTVFIRLQAAAHLLCRPRSNRSRPSNLTLTSWTGPVGHLALQCDGADAIASSPLFYRINISVCRGGNIFFPLRISITGFAQMPATMLATYTRTQVTAPSN